MPGYICICMFGSNIDGCTVLVMIVCVYLNSLLGNDWRGNGLEGGQCLINTYVGRPAVIAAGLSLGVFPSFCVYRRNSLG